jgi:valyl-tRNA synthetase
VAGVIDVAAERRRMEKDLAAARAEAGQAERKLANADFTAKAPAAVVDKTRQRLEVARADIARLEQRLAVLARGGDPPEPPAHGGATLPPIPPGPPGAST